MFKKAISLILSISLILTQPVFAQGVSELNIGKYLNQIPAVKTDSFRPARLRYISYDIVSNDFKLLLDQGDAKLPNSLNSLTPQLQDATQELFNYFLIGLSLPNDKFWVNLRPDAPQQIIDPLLEKTDMGKIMLEADLQLKKDTAGLTSPQNPEGKEYWDKLYKKAGELFGTENITIPTITRPWIVPGEVIIRESEDSAYIYKANLKVMLEEDYLNNQKTEKPKNQKTDDYNFSDPRFKELNKYSTHLIKELILPRLTQEINTSKKYAQLRQVFFSLILSRWFKDKYGHGSPVSGLQSTGQNNDYVKLIDSGNLTNLASKGSWSKDYYFSEYKKSFQQGEYNLKEQVSTPTGQVIRSYVSGGANLTGSPKPLIDGSFKTVASPLKKDIKVGFGGFGVVLISLLSYKLFVINPQIIRTYDPTELAEIKNVQQELLQEPNNLSLRKVREIALKNVTKEYNISILELPNGNSVKDFFQTFYSIVYGAYDNQLGEALNFMKGVLEEWDENLIARMFNVSVDILRTLKKEIMNNPNRMFADMDILKQRMDTPNQKISLTEKAEFYLWALYMMNTQYDFLPPDSSKILKHYYKDFGGQNTPLLIILGGIESDIQGKKELRGIAENIGELQEAFREGSKGSSPLTQSFVINPAEEVGMKYSSSSPGEKNIGLIVEKLNQEYERYNSTIARAQRLFFGIVWPYLDYSSIKNETNIPIIIESLLKTQQQVANAWRELNDPEDESSLKSDYMDALLKASNSFSNEIAAAIKELQQLSAMGDTGGSSPLTIEEVKKTIEDQFTLLSRSYKNDSEWIAIFGSYFYYADLKIDKGKDLDVLNSAISNLVKDVGKITDPELKNALRPLVDGFKNLSKAAANKLGLLKEDKISSALTQDLSQNSNSPLTTGGIDFTRINYLTRPMGSFQGLDLHLPLLSKAELEGIDIKQELVAIEQMVNARIDVSTDRLKRLLAATSQKDAFTSQRETQLLPLLMRLCWLKEEKGTETTPDFRAVLLIADTGLFVEQGNTRYSLN